MKRRPRKLFKLLLLLLAGAMANTTVSWALALRATPSGLNLFDNRFDEFSRGSKRLIFRRGELCATDYIRGKPQELIFATYIDLAKPLSEDEFASLLPSWSAFSTGAPIDRHRHLLRPADRWLVFTERCTGWPFLSLRTTCVTRTNDQATIVERCQGVRMPEEWRSWEGSAFPVIPAMPGFAINTIFYAAILWMLFALPGAVRRRVRIKRGQCASCGYSRRGSGSDKCPECGASMPNATRNGLA